MSNNNSTGPFKISLKKQRALAAAALLGATLTGALLSPLMPTSAQTGGNDSQPAPPSIGADVPVTYFGPPPSEVQKELVGPVHLLKAGQIDDAAGTITLPLYRGQMKNGRANVWYILTDTDDKANADALGLNFSGKLTYANVGTGVRVGHLEKDTSVTFDSGIVDFKPERQIVPGTAPDFFPPKTARPGSVGDRNYSPLVRIENAGNHIYNAPIIAFGVDSSQLNFCNGSPDYSRVHDGVLKICPSGEKNGGGTVTMKLAPGFSFSKPVLYLSTEASEAGVAAIEDVTFAPGLGDVTVGRDDSAFSAVERLFAVANGPMGKDNPQRQGLNSALGDPGVKGPLNVIGGIPTVATDYSPLWDVNLAVWTPDAISKGYRARVTDEFEVLGLAQKGWITGPGGHPFGSSGVIVNCPVVKRYL